MTLEGACKKLARQQFYNVKHTSVNHYSSEKLCKTAPKHEEPPDMTMEDYMSVSKLSMRLHVAAKLQLHYLFFT